MSTPSYMVIAPSAPGRRRDRAGLAFGLLFVASLLGGSALLFTGPRAERLRTTCGAEHCTVARAGLLGRLHPIGSYPLGALRGTHDVCGRTVDDEGHDGEACAAAFEVDGWTPLDPAFTVSEGRRLTFDPTLPRSEVLDEKTGLRTVRFDQVIVTRHGHDRGDVDEDRLLAAQRPGGQYDETLDFPDLPPWMNVAVILGLPVLCGVSLWAARATGRTSAGRPAGVVAANGPTRD